MFNNPYIDSIDVFWNEDQTLRESYRRLELAKRDLRIARNGLFKKIFKKTSKQIEETVAKAIQYNDNIIRERIFQLERRGINVVRFDGSDTI